MKNKEGLKSGVVAIVVLVVLGLAIIAAVLTPASDNRTIQDWASSNGYQVLKLERTFFDHGPFWLVSEDDRVYRVEILDEREKERTAYFKFGLFGHEQEWE